MLQENFPGWIISRGTDFPYLSHLPDLTSRDVYQWGVLEESLFNSEDPPSTVRALGKQIVSFYRSLQNPLWICVNDMNTVCSEAVHISNSYIMHTHANSVYVNFFQMK